MIKNKENLTKYIGQKFDNWLVIGIGIPKIYSNGKKGNKIELTLECECECGFCNRAIREVSFKNLKSGQSKGCGRKSRILNGKNNKKANMYDLSGEYGIGYTSKREEFYFDLEDFDKIKDYCWHKHQDGYMRTFIKIDSGFNRVLMHNLILKKENEDNDIDHINGKPNDNCKTNLRECNHCDNMKNTKLRSDNESGIIGVYFVLKKWKANITVNKRQIHLGTFENKYDAIKVRLQAEKDYLGEFSPQIYLFEEYNIK